MILRKKFQIGQKVLLFNYCLKLFLCYSRWIVTFTIIYVFSTFTIIYVFANGAVESGMRELEENLKLMDIDLNLTIKNLTRVI